MLNGYDNKNGNQQVYLAKITTTTTLHVQVTFCTFLCRCCCNVRLPSWTFQEGNASYVLTHTQKKLLLVFLFTFPFFLFLFLLFTVAHFHVAGHQHFSFSHHRYRILMFFFQRNSSPLFFISSCSSLFVFCCLLSRFLCLFLFSKFAKMASYLSLILQTTHIQQQFPLSFLSGYSRLLILASKDASGLVIFRQTNLELQLGNAIPVD